MSDDYEVGYGKPPKHSRFKKGRSGNPRGRPKGSKSVWSEFEAERMEKVMVREGGERKLVTKIRATFKSLFARAMAGDPKAIATVVELSDRLDPGHKGAAAGEGMLVKNESAREKLMRKIDRLAQAQAEEKAGDPAS